MPIFITLLLYDTCSLQDNEKKLEKISEMTAVMWQAANIEEQTDSAQDVISQLQHENHAMRELLQLEMFQSADPLLGPETVKTPSFDVAIQTQSSPDGDPFCTGDFATIRQRTLSARTQPSVEGCPASSDTQYSPFQQNPDNEVLFSTSSSSPENSADTSSDRCKSGDNGCSSAVVSDVDTTSADDLEIRNVNSSESLETLVNPGELSANDEYL